MKLDRLKIVDDLTNEIMFDISKERESVLISEYLIHMKGQLDEIKISYCHQCDMTVKKDIAYIKSIVEDNSLTDEDKFNTLKTEKISWETRCKLIKKVINYNHQFTSMTDEQLFDQYLQYVKKAYEEYNENDQQSVFTYHSVKDYDPNTLTMNDLMIEESVDSQQVRGHCGYDSYEQDNQYSVK
jgi:hypothetical protein